jgi:hypothetical protein
MLLKSYTHVDDGVVWLIDETLDLTNGMELVILESLKEALLSSTNCLKRICLIFPFQR